MLSVMIFLNVPIYPAMSNTSNFKIKKAIIQQAILSLNG
jgi:hypothetical protein